MKMIIGLGNPGKEYAQTKHNVGFMVIDAIADELNVTVEKRQCQAFTQATAWDGEKILLVKPQTYMNLSGESVREIIDYYKVDEENELIVIYDDISLDVGKLRIRKKGSAGGHNGMKNILLHLGHDIFPRIKMGVGDKPKGYDLADYVLGHFSKEDDRIMKDSVLRAIDAIKVIMEDGPDAAMNRYNG